MAMEPEPRFVGFAFLLRQAMKVGKILYSGLAGKYEVPTPLPVHPFSLPIPPEVAGERQRIEFIGHPGYTQVSTETLCAYLADWMQDASPDHLRYLRVILAEAHADYPERHRVYYEVGWHERVLICGGCTDYSGMGGVGKLRMDALFTFLSQFYGVEIETVTIPYREAEAVYEYLSKMVDSETFWKQEMQAAGR